MSSLGQWFFEKEKQSIMSSVRDRAPYVAKVAGASSDYKTVNIVDPYTNTTESELLTVAGPMPKANEQALILRLVDGERIALALRGYDRNFAQAGQSTESMALGLSASVTGRGQAVGTASEAVDASVAVGYLAKALGAVAVSMGYNAQAAGDYGIAMGYNASAAGTRAVAIGHIPIADLEGGIGIGYNAKPGRLAVALGYQAGAGSVTGELSVAIGYQAVTTAIHGVAIGRNTSAAQDAIAIGRLATATNTYAVAIGYNSTASQIYNVAIGTSASATGTEGIAIGVATKALWTRSIAIGYGAESSAVDQMKVSANELAIDRSSGSGQTSIVLRASNGTWKRLSISSTNVVTVTNA